MSRKALPSAAPPSAARPPGVILAGGRSLRMGQDKAAVMLDGKPLLQHVLERLAPQACAVGINSNTVPSPALAPGIAVFADTVPGHAGPMAGILSAMRHTAAQFPAASHVVTVPTDTPFFPLDLVSRLQAAITLPRQIAVAWSGGVMHPVFALWPVGIADDLEDWLLKDDKRRVRSFIERHPAQRVDFPVAAIPGDPVDPFFNINTQQDLRMATRWLPLFEEMER